MLVCSVISICLGRPIATQDEDCYYKLPLNMSDGELESYPRLPKLPNTFPQSRSSSSESPCPTTGFLAFAPCQQPTRQASLWPGLQDHTGRMLPRHRPAALLCPAVLADVGRAGRRPRRQRRLPQDPRVCSTGPARLQASRHALPAPVDIGQPREVWRGLAGPGGTRASGAWL